MGLLYWVDDVQVYNKNGWSYISKVSRVSVYLLDTNLCIAYASVLYLLDS